MTLEEISRTIGIAGLLLNGQGSREKESLFNNLHIDRYLLLEQKQCQVSRRSRLTGLCWCTIVASDSTAQSSRRAGKNPHANVCSILSSRTFLAVRTERTAYDILR
jgi:hypothetical protein